MNLIHKALITKKVHIAPKMETKKVQFAYFLVMGVTKKCILHLKWYTTIYLNIYLYK